MDAYVQTSWKDKPLRAIPYLLIYMVPISVIFGHYLGGWWNFLTPLSVFGFIPFLDLLVGVNKRNLTEAEEKDRRDAWDYRAATWIAAPVQVTLMLWGVHLFSTSPMSLIERIGLVFSVGISGGALGINVSHELVHRINNNNVLPKNGSHLLLLNR